MAVDLGEVVVRSVQFTAADGTPVAPDATPTYAVTLPDGSAGSPPAVNAGSLGEYYVNYVPAVTGLHVDVWSGLVGTLPVKFGPDAFVVRGAALAPLIGIAEMRRICKVGADASRDEQIRDYNDAAIELCEDFTGRTYRRQTIVETQNGGGTAIALRRTPVQSITSATEDGTTVTGSGWVLDAASGLLYRGTTAGASWWADGVQNVVITYVAAPSVVSARVRQANRVTLAHLWTTQGGASRGPQRATGSVEDYATNAPGWSLPRAAEQLLGSDLAPGFA